MKIFLAAFVSCFILCAFFLIFGGIRLLLNVWGAAALFSLFVAIGVSLLAEQERRIETLEQRIRALEQEMPKHEGEASS